LSNYLQAIYVGNALLSRVKERNAFEVQVGIESMNYTSTEIKIEVDETHAPLGKSCNIISQYLPPAIRILFPFSLPSSVDIESPTASSCAVVMVVGVVDTIVSNPPDINLISPKASVISSNFSDDNHVPHSYRNDSCAFTCPLLLTSSPLLLLLLLLPAAIAEAELLELVVSLSLDKEVEDVVEEVRAIASSNEHASDVARKSECSGCDVGSM